MRAVLTAVRGARHGLALRSATLAWILVPMLLVTVGANPHSAAASVMQMHGALRNPEAVGIVSHRGAAALAPENTLAAMRIALEQGVEFVETDVHLTADGVPVLMHDPTLDRTTNGTGPVAARTFAEVRALDAGGWFSREYAGEPVPALEEFVGLLARSTTRALVELKGEWSDTEIVQVVEMLRGRHMVNRIALQSFEPETLEMLGSVAPEFARILLTREWDDRVASLAKEMRVSAVGARPKLLDRRPELLAELQRVGIGALVYTLNDERRWERAAESGFDLVVTDDPVRFAAWRGDAPVVTNDIFGASVGGCC